MQTSKLRSCLKIQNNVLRSVSSLNTANTTDQLKPYAEIPGPSSMPLIGQMHHFLPGGEFYNMSVFDLSVEFYKKYGPIVKLPGFPGNPDIVMLFDPESSGHVLRSENVMSIRPGFQSLDYYRKNANKGDGPNGLLTDQGEVWKKFRSTVNPVLLQPKTIKLYSDKIDEVAQDMIKRLKSIRGEDNKLNTNFDMEMNLWSLESVGLVAMGRRLNCFNSNLPANSPEKKIIQLLHNIFDVVVKLDFKPSLWRYYPTKTFKKAMKLYEEQANIARYFINKTIEEIIEKGESKTDDEKGVLEKLLELDKEMAITMACDMLFAGVDTTSNAITATIYLLAKNPDKQEKLREEVNSQQGRRPYLKACLKESLRMMPVVVGNARIIRKDISLLGYHIPKGIQVSFMHQIMSMMEEHYPRANEFIPERWITSKDDSLHYLNAHPFASNPFGFGVRACIGRRIAELELETFLTRLIQNFKVEWHGEPMKVKTTSINYATGPFHFVFRDA